MPVDTHHIVLVSLCVPKSRSVFLHNKEKGDLNFAMEALRTNILHKNVPSIHAGEQAQSYSRSERFYDGSWACVLKLSTP